MSILLELLIEFLIQLVFEVPAEFVEAALRRNRERSRESAPLHPIAATAIYLLLGAVLGWISFLCLPQQFIAHPGARIANLILTPIAVGLVLGAIGGWRARRGMAQVRLDKFAYGYTFALAFAVARFLLGG